MDRASEQSYCDFVAARRPGLIREAYLLVGDVHLAEDLVQTVLAKSYVAWHRVRASGAPDAYVRKILVSRCAGGWVGAWARAGHCGGYDGAGGVG